MLRKHGVDVQHVRVVDGMSSGVAVIVLDDMTGNNRIKITPGVNPSVLPDHPPEVEILIVSESEAALLTGVDFTVPGGKLERQEAPKIESQRGRRLLIERGARDIAIVVTLGASGAYYHDHQSRDHGWFNAHRIENAMDSTGAGDMFVGAIAVNYVELKHPEGEFCIEGGVSTATDAAAYSVQQSGTWQSMP